MIAGLALVAASIGLFHRDEGRSFTFSTVRGESVTIWGRGWYRYNGPIAAFAFMAADAITLVVAIPLLVSATLRYRRGSIVGGFLLTGTLAYVVYNYASVAFGAAYNNLFTVYVTLMAASLFALFFAFASFDLTSLLPCFAASLPRRSSVTVSSARSMSRQRNLSAVTLP